MKPIQHVSVFGLGKLGSCIAATLAMRGTQVLGVDIDREKVSRINQGLPPVEEPLLAETIRQGRSRLRATLTPHMVGGQGVSHLDVDTGRAAFRRMVRARDGTRCAGRHYVHS